MVLLFLFIKENTAYEVRIRYWGSDVSSSDLRSVAHRQDSNTFNGWFAGSARLANENRRVAVAAQSAVRAASTRRNGSYRLGALFTSPTMTARQSVVSGKSASLRGALVGSRILYNNNSHRPTSTPHYNI